jgi:hypothetical protein
VVVAILQSSGGTKFPPQDIDFGRVREAEDLVSKGAQFSGGAEIEEKKTPNG